MPMKSNRTREKVLRAFEARPVRPASPRNDAKLIIEALDRLTAAVQQLGGPLNGVAGGGLHLPGCHCRYPLGAVGGNT